MNTEITPDTLWEQIVKRQGELFYTKKGLPFTYYIKGGELFASRRERSITKSTFEKAFQKIRQNPHEISGPKKLMYMGRLMYGLFYQPFLEQRRTRRRYSESICRAGSFGL